MLGRTRYRAREEINSIRRGREKSIASSVNKKVGEEGRTPSLLPCHRL